MLILTLFRTRPMFAWGSVVGLGIWRVCPSLSYDERHTLRLSAMCAFACCVWGWGVGWGGQGSGPPCLRSSLSSPFFFAPKAQSPDAARSGLCAAPAAAARAAAPGGAGGGRRSGMLGLGPRGVGPRSASTESETRRTGISGVGLGRRRLAYF